MFNEFVILHTPPKIEPPPSDKNTLSAEKMTQTGEGIWQVSIITSFTADNFPLFLRWARVTFPTTLYEWARIIVKLSLSTAGVHDKQI